MKRDKELMRLLLLHVRDGDKAEVLAKYPENVQGFHAALLVNDGLVNGAAIRDHTGTFVGAAMDGLTSEGYDFLETSEEPPVTAVPEKNLTSIELFISHASEDAKLAEALVELLQTSLRLPSKEIRCTSVNGFRLPVGVDANEQLKRETVSSRAFIGLITPRGIQSAYVLFELGARWGAGLTISPVFAKGADSSSLKGPIHALNALDARDTGQVHQLLYDLSQQLTCSLEPVAVFNKHLAQFVEEASKEATSKKGKEPQHVLDGMAELVRQGLAFRDRMGGAFGNLTDAFCINSDAEKWAEEVKAYLSQNVGAFAIVEFESVRINRGGTKPSKEDEYHNKIRDFINGRILGLELVVKNLREQIKSA